MMAFRTRSPRCRSVLCRSLALRLALPLAAVSLAALGRAHAASPAELPALEHSYYRVELVLFARDVLEASDERLPTMHGPSLPGSLRALNATDAERRERYRLEERTIAMIEGRIPEDWPDEPQPEITAEPVDEEPLHDDARIDTEPAASLEGEPSQPSPAVPAEPLPKPTPEELAREAFAQHEQLLLASSFTPLPPDGLALASAAARLDRHPAYRVLLHTAWVQPVPDRENEEPLPLLVQAGERTGDAWEVEGVLSVAQGRFLHFDAELWFREPVLDATAEVAPVTSNGSDPASALSTATLPAGGPNAAAAQARVAAPSSADPDHPSARWTKLEESRRMRSGEVHYLDHPRFGMLVRIDPEPLPPELVQMLERLQKPQQ